MYYRRRDFLAGGLAAGVTLAFGPSFWRQALAAVPAAPGPGAVWAARRAPMPTACACPRGSRRGWSLAGPAGRGLRLCLARGLRRRYDLRELGGWLDPRLEVDGGIVWECDPLVRLIDGKIDPPPVARPALGVFNHEAVAVDPVGKRIYLSEDKTDGGLYRSSPASWPDAPLTPDLSAGSLEVATVAGDGKVSWSDVPNPAARTTPTRRQVAGSTSFGRGDGS